MRGTRPADEATCGKDSRSGSRQQDALKLASLPELEESASLPELKGQSS